MQGLRIAGIPAALRELDHWVLWRIEQRGDKPTKVPLQVSGGGAKSNDPATWSEFGKAAERFQAGGYTGIGFMFGADDPFCGIDLDGCRDPKSGAVAEWAREVILKFDSYAEVSPSQTGIKIFCRAKSPFSGGKKITVDAESMCDKTPAIEVYDQLRYFAVTGWRVKGPAEPQERQAAMDWLKDKYWPAVPTQVQLPFRSDEAVLDRARKYLAKLPPAISGQSGHNATFHAACVLVCGFDLGEGDALALMREFNETCHPPWSEKELLHKVSQAMKQPGQRGYLKYAAPERWDRIALPNYREPAPKHEPRETTLVEATKAYIETLKTGKTTLIETGIGDLDYALGGGLEKGELVIFAARPSHGKSAVGLQCVHHWTQMKMPCVIVSEEMSSLALGKRTVQFVSDVPQEHWFDLVTGIEQDIEAYARTRAKCLVLEGCGTAEAAVEAIERAVREHNVECVVVDYAQLLGAPGKDRYQQMTAMSLALRQLASSQKIILLALCQMSRSIESRAEFVPVLSDLKESGQLEQDADVVVFLCWPHRQDAQEPVNKYQFFISKNRNRGTNQNMIVCRFLPDRQMIKDPLPEVSHDGEIRERNREPSRRDGW